MKNKKTLRTNKLKDKGTKLKPKDELNIKFKTTEEIKVPKKLIDQVIGQEEAVKIMKKAALQRRHVLLIGEPGTGKSMLGMGLAELLPKEKLVDILAYPNPNDEFQPIIKTVPSGKGREIVARAKLEAKTTFKGSNWIFIVLLIIAMLTPWWTYNYYSKVTHSFVVGAVMFAATFIGGMFFLVAFMVFMSVGKKMIGQQITLIPKLIVDNFGKKHAPFIDGTGAHAGALLGDVLHDPLQSGGLGTPPHLRVIAGLIHKAHMGVLFIDEIATLHVHTQQELLTALQEGSYPITGQSERSAGAMVRTQPVPCKFILVAAGNLETIKHMHPALRSRIRGYGYEVFMNDTMKDTPENRAKLARFVAQEVRKDSKIPHFTRDAVLSIIQEARKMASRKGHLTLRLRELGGLVRAAGDIAKEQGAKYVTAKHVEMAKQIARPLEKQIADKYTERKKEYEVIITTGTKVGRVNGLAVIGTGSSFSGIVLPIDSEVVKGGKEKGIVATGRLGEIAKEAIKNVSAIIKKYFGDDIKDYDIYVQFLQTYEGVEGDSASIAVATAILSALKNIPVRQDFAMTGSLSVKGDVLPVGGVSSKVEAAIEAGIKNIIVPKTNVEDIILPKEKLNKINIIPVSRIEEVWQKALDWKGRNKILAKINQMKQI